jgi:hypothetical protein
MIFRHPLLSPLFARVSPAPPVAGPAAAIPDVLPSPCEDVRDQLSAREVNTACRFVADPYDDDAAAELFYLCGADEDRVRFALAVAREVEAARATLRRAMPDIEAVTEEVA